MTIEDQSVEEPQELHFVEKTKTKRNLSGLYILILVVIVSRIPFIDVGYGSDPDAWRLANVARNIYFNQAYEQSRFPGHPVQEVLCAFFWKTGPVGLNGLTLIFSTIGILFFALTLLDLNIKNYFLLSSALAFTPVIYINSVNSMDYIWALSFILAAMYFTVKKKPIIAGILLGIAVGCRITSCLMIIPLIILFFRNNDKSSYSILLKFVISSILVGVTLYVPVYLRYGIDFLKYDDPGGYSLLQILRTMVLGVWEIIGILAIVFSLVFSLIKNRKFILSRVSNNKMLLISCLSSIFLILIAFSRLPYRSGYLIPAVPFVIILLYLILDLKLIKFICISIVLSSFFVSMYSSAVTTKPISSKYSINFDFSGKEFVLDFLKGPIFIDHSRRIEDIKYMNEVIKSGRKITDKSAFAVGDLLPFIQTTLRSKSDGPVEYIYLFSLEDIKQYSDQNYKLYYLSEVRKNNLDIYGIDPRLYGVKPITIEY